ncbi:MAG: M13 family metallopeptidase [Acidobacteriota bacterium]
MSLSTRPLIASLLVLLALVPAGCRAPSGPGPAARATPGFDIEAIDRSVDPCDDFYQYACGNWIANNPIPPDRGVYTRFSELQERNLAILRDILEQARQPDPGRSPAERLIGDLYAACMDEDGVEERGAAPLRADLDRIDAMTSKDELASVIARLHAGGLNSVPSFGRAPTVLFGFESEQDFKDATSQIAAVDQGGLGLPDRDYYLKEDDRSRETRDKYREHVRAMFALLGERPERAAEQAGAVMEVETALARASLDLVSRRDPAKIYHKMTRAGLAALAPSFSWESYFESLGAPPIGSLNVRVPDFFKGVEALIREIPLESLKSYLRWQVARITAPLLSSPFVNANFEFYGKTLGGAKELRARWKRCVQLVDANLGEALGRPYVERTLGAEGKERTLRMVRALERALEKDIEELPWMSDATKRRALEKLHAITNKIGYPDEWRDYGSIRIDRGDLVGDVRRCRSFEMKRWLDKIGKPVDPDEWFMSPPTVNAYYDPQMNNINFPAGILQPPFYDNAMDDAVNFGGIGMVIGHELTHGFDDQGRQFDAAGNLHDWWTEEDDARFRERAECFVEQYAGYTAVDELKLNGRLTLGENVADNGGLRIAFAALADTLGGRPAEPIDGFTPAQRLFLGNAQVWCANVSEEAARLRAQTDPHSLYRYRVNGVISNMPEFREAFGCEEGDPMVREAACRVW